MRTLEHRKAKERVQLSAVRTSIHPKQPASWLSTQTADTQQTVRRADHPDRLPEIPSSLGWKSMPSMTCSTIFWPENPALNENIRYFTCNAAYFHGQPVSQSTADRLQAPEPTPGQCAAGDSMNGQTAYESTTPSGLAQHGEPRDSGAGVAPMRVRVRLVSS